MDLDSLRIQQLISVTLTVSVLLMAKKYIFKTGTTFLYVNNNLIHPKPSLDGSPDARQTKVNTGTHAG